MWYDINLLMAALGVFGRFLEVWGEREWLVFDVN